MILWSALRRLLPLLAVLSLALTPVSASAAIAGLHAPMARTGPSGPAHQSLAPDGHGHAQSRDHAHAADHAHAGAMSMAMAAMPCCPPDDAAASAPSADGSTNGPATCLKACPLMALCLGSLAALPPSGLSLPVRAVAATAAFIRREADFASVSGTPLPEPPRT